ncbi:MAG: molybdenum cofactor guanylyltransferase [Planctomycetes bacterium]|nr:molybdenum cofactor guanylyltransferase [Planctomycetota bacterium]
MRTARTDVTGLLLCGGESRRMGRDKALLPWGERTMIDGPLDALRELASRVLLSTGRTARYPQLGLECVLDAFPDAGPLAGLCAGLEACRTPWLAVLSCDLPLARAECLRRLLERAEESGWDAALLELPRGSQPLYGVYRASCRSAVRSALERGERRMVSFHGALAVGSVAAARLGPEAERSALNLNTPEDLRTLEQEALRSDTMGTP